MIHFCFDHMSSPGILGYPNLARQGLQPDEFDITWPRTVPLRLLVYLEQFGFQFRSHLVEHAPDGAWYPIALGWHDFECDYFSLISDQAKTRARHHQVRFLFYYHEGDHPGRIKQRLDFLCDQYALPRSCYVFISANSSANQHPNFLYFNDHEYFLSYINRKQHAASANNAIRPYEFTVLNRIHKWWRAAVMSDLHNQGLLDRSLWSYNTNLSDGDQPQDNPIRLDQQSDWKVIMQKFLAQGPYICDGTDSTAHNDHRYVNTDLYNQSYCHLVMETLFDVDQSGGTFLTEKTYKCMKFGQPFVIIGPVGSLQVLRDSGYRVFDHMIDNSYDQIIDNTERWSALRKSILEVRGQDMHQWFLGCLDDVHHNQWMFSTKSHAALDRLVQALTEHRHIV